MMCQPITFQIDFSGSDQIQTPQYPEIHLSSQETSDKVFQANHSVQNEESSNEIAISNSNQEKEEPPKNSDICLLIREECSTEVREEQKQSMEDTMLELVKICQEKEFLCIHDDIDDVIESALNSKLLLINSNSQRLDKKEKEVKNVIEQPAEREKQPEHLLSMGYKHLSITPETESDEVTESNAESLLPIPSECEVTSEDKRECNVLVYEDSSTADVCDNHSEILFDSNNNDDISSDDESFEDIEYVDASLPDPKIVSVEEENVVQQEEEEVDFEDISQIQDVLREILLSITRLISNIESLNENSTLDHVFNSFESDNSLLDIFRLNSKLFAIIRKRREVERLINLVKNNIFDDLSSNSLLEEVDLFLFDNSIPPGIENVTDDPEGDIYFLEELLIDDSILSHEPFNSNLEDNPSIPRPPPEPPDAQTDAGEETLVMMNDKDEDVYSYFIFVFFIRCFLYSPQRVRI
nr:hypothetical protein [Tanacetum cinerariifolium]